MITTGDIQEIIYDLCRDFEVEIWLKDNLDFSEIEDERIVIIPTRITTDKYWHNSYVKIDWCVPDIDGEADTIRTKEIEHLLEPLHYGNGIFDEKTYRFKKESSEVSYNAEMKCHFVNLTLLFQYQNVK